tara:strand:+ start:839 stop:1258 length:420 start_codon:yes stop_codon:yes gene_type:complete
MRRALIFTAFLMIGCSTDDHTSAAEIQLADINGLYDVLVDLESTPDVSRETKRKVEDMIVQKIILVRAVNPKIDDLKGAGLEGLCTAYLFSQRKNSIVFDQNPELSKIVVSYLSSVRDEVEIKIAKLKQSIWAPDKCPI